MTEMNELTRSLVRVEELITQGASQGAQHVLWTAQEYARQAVKLISYQGALMAKQQLKINELSERMAYWQQRAESAEAEIKELDEQEHTGVITRIEFNDDSVGKVAIRWDAKKEPCLGDSVYVRPVPAKRAPEELRQWYVKLTNADNVQDGENVNGKHCTDAMLADLETILKIGE